MAFRTAVVFPVATYMARLVSRDGCSNVKIQGRYCCCHNHLNKENVLPNFLVPILDSFT